MRLIVLLLSMNFALPAFSAGHGEARSAYDRGEYLTARQLVIPPAQAGVADAQFLLGQMYVNGDGVLQDYVQAHKWLNLAASGGNREARALRNTISNRMTSAQLAEAQSLARAWQPSATPKTSASTLSTSPASAGSAAVAGAATAQRATTTAPRSRRQLVRNIQTMLNELGYDAGPADGLMGRRTRNAIRSYQLHSGLESTGQPSADLHRTLAADLGYADQDPTHSEAALASAPVQEVQRQERQPQSPAQTASSNPPIYVQEAKRNRRTAVSSGPTRQKPAQQRPANRSVPAPAAGDPVQRLRAIIDAGEERGAVRGRFLRRLRALVERHDLPWRQLIAEDTFGDGDFTRSPRWDVLSGEFWVHEQNGLRSNVLATAPGQPQADSASAGDEKLSGKELGIALLGVLLQQGQQQQGGGSTSGNISSSQFTAAHIRLGAGIPASFAIELELLSAQNLSAQNLSAQNLSAQNDGNSEVNRLELGVYQRGGDEQGYRVAYLAGAAQGLELSRTRTGQQSVLELSRGPVKLEDGTVHKLRWTRDRDGYMRVGVDGQDMIAISDRSISGTFDGFSLINRGGNYGLRSIRILGEP